MRQIKVFCIALYGDIIYVPTTLLYYEQRAGLSQYRSKDIIFIWPAILL